VLRGCCDGTANVPRIITVQMRLPAFRYSGLRHQKDNRTSSMHDFRFTPDSDRRADIPGGPLCAITGSEQVQQIASLFDQLVGGHLHDQRHRDAECLRRFEIDDEFDLGRLHHRKVCGLLTLEDAIDIEGRLAERVV
jgi:hypothetical protein